MGLFWLDEDGDGGGDGWDGMNIGVAGEKTYALLLALTAVPETDAREDEPVPASRSELDGSGELDTRGADDVVGRMLEERVLEDCACTVVERNRRALSRTARREIEERE